MWVRLEDNGVGYEGDGAGGLAERLKNDVGALEDDGQAGLKLTAWVDLKMTVQADSNTMVWADSKQWHRQTHRRCSCSLANVTLMKMLGKIGLIQKIQRRGLKGTRKNTNDSTNRWWNFCLGSFEK